MTIETANEDRVAVGHRAAIDSRETSGLRFRYGARGFRSPVTVVLGALARRRLRVASLAAHPELVVAAAVLAAWVLLLVFAARAVGGATSAAMPGMPMPVTSGSPWPTAVAALPSWVLMTVAMMGPAALSKFRDVATLSAMAAFGVAYLAVWAVFGLLAEAAATAIRGVPSPQALALCLAVATAWQFTPLKHRVLRGCLGAEPAEFQPAAARRATSACASHQPAAAAGNNRAYLLADAEGPHLHPGLVVTEDHACSQVDEQQCLGPLVPMRRLAHIGTEVGKYIDTHTRRAGHLLPCLRNIQ